MKSLLKKRVVHFLLVVFLFLPAAAWNLYCGGGGGRIEEDAGVANQDAIYDIAEWGFELSPTKGAITGVIFDADGKPLEGVTLNVKDQQIIAKSQSDGRFGLPYEPKGGSEEIIVDVKIDGFTTAHKLIRVQSNRTVTIGKVYLVVLDTATTAIGAQGGTHKSANGNMTMDIPEGAVDSEQNFRTTWFPAGKTLPGDLPETSFFTYAMELEPDGAEFTKPVKTKFKNERGFAPGTPIPVGYFNKETGRWEHEGMGDGGCRFNGGVDRIRSNAFFTPRYQLSNDHSSGCNQPRSRGRSDGRGDRDRRWSLRCVGGKTRKRRFDSKTRPAFIQNQPEQRNKHVCLSELY
ncbi:MAG: hypothetical protein ABIE74_03835, partial [Pseudomonadota bacterium]